MIKRRCNKFIEDSGASISQFCKRIKLSVSGYSRWQKGELKLSDATEKRIDDFLKQFNY